MRILTWNVLHPDYVDSDLESKYLEWEYRKERIRSIISREIDNNVDVICLQEADSSKLLDYSFNGYTLFYQNDKTRTKKLNKWIIGGCNPKDKPNTLVCIILVKDGMNVSNMVVGSRSLTLTINGVKVTNVHLEAGTGVTDIHIKHLSKMLDSDIVLGDFNDFPGEPAMEFLSERGFNKIPNRITFKHPKDKKKQWTFDYVFYKDRFTCSNVVWQDEFTGLSPDHPSDHMMIVVEINSVK